MLTERQFKDIYNRYQSSGLTIRSFCTNEGINESRFYYWQRRLKHILNGKSNFGFIPLKVEGSHGLAQGGDTADNPVFSSLSNSVKSNSNFEITYPNGTRLKFTGDADYELVKSLLLLKR